VLFQGLFDLWKRWLACQRLTFVPMICMIIGSFLHIVLCYLCLDSFGMGVIGLAVATACKDAILFATIVIYARCSPQVNQVLQSIDSDAFRGWSTYLRVSLPSTAMLCSEWWAFEVVFVLGGILGVLELAALSICLNVHSLLYRVPLGITEATSALLGNSIGANNVPLAKRFASVNFKFGGTFILL